MITFQHRAHRRAGAPASAAFALLASLWLCLSLPAAARAQDGGGEQPTSRGTGQGAFPDAIFDVGFRKYTPPETDYTPYYSWDTDVAMDITLFRKGAGAVNFGGVVQTVGTEPLGSQIGVGGTGYVLRAGYRHTHSEALELSGGIEHLSSHLTRDLDDKTDEQREQGIPIPDPQDPDEYNVFYVKGRLSLRRWPLTPEFEAVLHPVNFRFDGGSAPYVRPLYLTTRWVLWRGAQTSLLVWTQHEVGHNAFNYFSLSLGMYAKGQPEGRFQVFAAFSPGGGLHVSPNIGALRDGLAFGVRMRFRAGRG